MIETEPHPYEYDERRYDPPVYYGTVDPWADLDPHQAPVPEDQPLGHCVEPDCKDTYVDQPVDRILASKEGWFFMKDGRTYCPDHNPPWVAEWRARR